MTQSFCDAEGNVIVEPVAAFFRTVTLEAAFEAFAHVQMH